jgi:hypothetical protein
MKFARRRKIVLQLLRVLSEVDVNVIAVERAIISMPSLTQMCEDLPDSAPEYTFV